MSFPAPRASALSFAGLDASEAGAHVAAGGLLAFPTETVWGLGADATDAEAVARLRALKGRDAHNPLSVLVRDSCALASLGVALVGAARALASAFWPGPLTLVLPVAGESPLARGVASETGALGIRCSSHPVASAIAGELARRGAGPMTATSLNASGDPPAHCRSQAAALCERAAAEVRLAIASGGDAQGAPPSSVVDCTGRKPLLLREGAVAAEDLLRALHESGLAAHATTLQRPGELS